MDNEKILAVADAIEGDTVANLKFDMKIVTDNDPSGDGYVGCIAGYTIALLFSGNIERVRWDSHTIAMNHAAEVLGLDENQRNMLFIPDNGNNSPYDATPKQAAAVLRHLAETGDVDWDRALEPAQ